MTCGGGTSPSTTIFPEIVAAVEGSGRADDEEVVDDELEEELVHAASTRHAMNGVKNFTI
jgi:hypothetical protein